MPKTSMCLSGNKGGVRENPNSKTLILKDSSVRSIWTYLTASLCYAINTNKHNKTTNIISIIRERERETETETESLRKGKKDL